MSEMHRVLADGRRQMTRPCPGCGRAVGLWLRVLEISEAAEYRRKHEYVAATASIVTPDRRLAAMQADADVENKGAIVPWINCLSCGYDDHYEFGVPHVAAQAGA